MGSIGQIFNRETQAIFYNWKPNPVQRMLDFDFLCGELPAWVHHQLRWSA
jgi:ATP citrate (pro-S)-lyase